MNNIYMDTYEGIDDAFNLGMTQFEYKHRHKGRDYGKANQVFSVFGSGSNQFAWWTGVDTTDHPIHAWLKKQPGFDRIGQETFRIDTSLGLTLEIVRDMIQDQFFSDTPRQVVEFEPRRYQTEFVKKANIEYCEFLLAAKCRAGKSAMVLLHIVDKKDKVSLVVSRFNSPKSSWQNDPSTFKQFENIRFVDMKDKDWKSQLKKYMERDNIQVVLWSTVQGLNHSKTTKFKTLSNIVTPDRIVFDECHVGDNTKQLNQIIDHFDGVPVLKVSGTAFNQIWNTTEDNRYVYGYFEEQIDVKKGLFKRPKMKLVVANYQSNLYSKVYGDDPDKFNNMFLINESGDDFVDRELVRDFITNIFDQNKYQKKQNRLLNKSNHIIMSLPSTKACELFSNMINHKHVGGFYGLDICSKNNQDQDTINKFVGEHDRTVSVTVSANVLGVTCKEWDTVIHCRGGNSIKDWTQLSFRGGSGDHDWRVIDFNSTIGLYSLRDMFSQAQNNNPELAEYVMTDFTPVVEWSDGYSELSEDKINEIMALNVTNVTKILSGLGGVVDVDRLVDYDFKGSSGDQDITKQIDISDESLNNEPAKKRQSSPKKGEGHDFDAKKRRVKEILSLYSKVIHYGFQSGKECKTLNQILDHPEYQTITGDDENLVRMFINDGVINVSNLNRKINDIYPLLKTKFINQPDTLFEDLFVSSSDQRSLTSVIFTQVLSEKVGEVILLVGDPDGFHTFKAIEMGYKPENIWVWDDTSRGQLYSQFNHVNIVHDLFSLTMKFDVIVGNPPYGSGGNLAIKFLNKCGDLSDDVRLVLPLSVRKVSSVNKIRLDMICVSDDQLPDETFPGGIRTVLQRWVKTDTLRDKIETITTHPDFDFVKKGDPNTNVFVMRSGHAGKVLTEGYEDYEHSHYFIHAKTSEVIETLKQCETKFREVAKMTNGMDKLSKHELVTLYMECVDK